MMNICTNKKWRRGGYLAIVDCKILGSKAINKVISNPILSRKTHMRKMIECGEDLPERLGRIFSDGKMEKIKILRSGWLGDERMNDFSY